MTLELDDIVKLINLALAVGAIFFTFFSNRKKDTDVRFQEGSKRMDNHELRLTTLEQTVRTMPGKDDLHQLQLEVTRVAGSMDKIGAMLESNGQTMSRLEHTQSRLEEFLLNGGYRS